MKNLHIESTPELNTDPYKAALSPLWSFSPLRLKFHTSFIISFDGLPNKEKNKQPFVTKTCFCRMLNLEDEYSSCCEIEEKTFTIQSEINIEPSFCCTF